MPIRDDIAALLADERRGPDERRADVRKLRGQSVHDALAALKGQPFRYRNVEWTVWDLWLEDDGELVCFTVKAVRVTGPEAGAILLRPQDIFRVANPPTHAENGVDDRVLAVKQMLSGLVP